MKKRKMRGIPTSIGVKEVEKALDWISKHRWPPKRNSIRWVHDSRGIRCPPKYMISIASRYATGRELDSDDFTAHMANNYLKKLGYRVVDKSTGEVWGLK